MERRETLGWSPPCFPLSVSAQGDTEHAEKAWGKAIKPFFIEKTTILSLLQKQNKILSHGDQNPTYCTLPFTALTQ